MKKTWAALLALCLLAATLVALAEEPVVVDDDVEIVFGLADYDEGWEAATLAPAEATPEELARLKEIYSQVDRWIGNAPEEDAVPEGKLAFVVYSDDGSDEPVTSYCHGILFGEVPAERLAASLD